MPLSPNQKENQSIRTKIYVLVTKRDNGYEMNCLERKLVLVLKRKTMVLQTFFNQHLAVDANNKYTRGTIP